MLRVLATVAALIWALCATPLLAQPVQLPDEIVKLHTVDMSCDPLEDFTESDVQYHGMGDGYFVYLVPCFFGAYNFGYRFYIDAKGLFFKELFAEYSGQSGWYGVDILFLSDFDPKTGILHSHYKGRGIGDCGTSGTWQWDGSHFALVTYRAKDECDGDMTEWPIVFAHANPPAWTNPDAETGENPVVESDTEVTSKDKISQ